MKFEQVEQMFQSSLWRIFYGTKLAEQKYIPLPMGPNRKRTEDIHLIEEHIYILDILDDAEFIRKHVEKLAIEASAKIFAAGKPLGFYNMHLPGCVDYKSVHRLENSAHGLTFRTLMAYDIYDDSHTFALGLRPEYDEEIIDLLMGPGTTAGLIL